MNDAFCALPSPGRDDAPRVTHDYCSKKIYKRAAGMTTKSANPGYYTISMQYGSPFNQLPPVDQPPQPGTPNTKQ